MDTQAAPTFSDYVVDRLRGDIVSGVFAPGARLAMRELTQLYQVGASPIREALHRLTGEGFVHFFGQRGFRVPPLSLEDLEDLTHLRLMIDEAATRQAIERGDDAWEAGIVAAFHRLERQLGRFTTDDEAVVRQYDAVHRGFHGALFAGVVSPRLAALSANLFDQAFRYRKLLHREPIAPQQVIDEHRRLMHTLLARDAEAAVAAVRLHLRLTRDPAQRHLRGSPAGAARGRPGKER